MMHEEQILSEAHTASSAQTAGALLRTYREALGLELAAIASHLHVPLSKLKALEEDRLQDLPDTVFARSLALAVCRHLNQDAAQVLALLPQYDANRLAVHDERGLNSPIRRPALSTQPMWPMLLHRLSALRWVGVVLLLLGAGLAFLPELERLWVSREASTSSATTVAPVATQEAAPEAEQPIVQGQMVVTPVHSTLLQALPAASQASAAGDANAR
jgi:cytoskeleton protein RodZ